MGVNSPSAPGLEEGPAELHDMGDFATSPLQPSTSIIWGDFLKFFLFLFLS